MHFDRQSIVVLVGAIIAFLLQIIIAPAIAIFTTQPDVLLAYVLVVAILRRENAGPLLPFVLGLLYDLLGTGPVGGMAFLYVLVSLIASRVFMVLDNDTVFMPLITIVVATFLVEVLYGGLLIALGMQVGFVDAFIYRALPCALYTCAVALVIYPLVSHFFARGAQEREMRTPQLR